MMKALFGSSFLKNKAILMLDWNQEWIPRIVKHPVALTVMLNLDNDSFYLANVFIEKKGS